MTAINNKVNLCLVQRSEFDMIYATDQDGSLSPSTMLSQGPSALLASDDAQLLTFLNGTSCVYISNGCYNYCQNTCFRSIRYSYEGLGQEALTLRVCKRDDPNLCATFSGGRRGDSGAHSYIAHLPVGNVYEAILLDKVGLEVDSGLLTETYEASSCPASPFSIYYVGSLIVSNKESSAVLEDTEDTSIYKNDDDDHMDDDL
jgi:hypothetical protein